MVGTMLAYGWNNVGLWLVQCWFTVGQTLAYMVYGWLIVGTLLGDGWDNVGLWLVQCWFIVGQTLAYVGL